MSSQYAATILKDMMEEDYLKKALLEQFYTIPGLPEFLVTDYYCWCLLTRNVQALQDRRGTEASELLRGCAQLVQNEWTSARERFYEVWKQDNTNLHAALLTILASTWQGLHSNTHQINLQDDTPPIEECLQILTGYCIACPLDPAGWL